VESKADFVFLDHLSFERGERDRGRRVERVERMIDDDDSMSNRGCSSVSLMKMMMIDRHDYCYNVVNSLFEGENELGKQS